MHKWLLILYFLVSNAYSEVGEISELRGNGEVLRANQEARLSARTSLDILSYDDVRTGNGRLGITFLDSSVIRLTEHSKSLLMSMYSILIHLKAKWHSKWRAELPALLQVRWGR